MDSLWTSLINVGHWVTGLGLAAALITVGLLVFAESGLLIGIFLPGDSLLLACGIFAAQGDVPLMPMLAVIFVAAVLGDNAGYMFGRRTGQRLLTWRNNRLFRKEYLQKAETYFETYGQKTVFFARFIPYIRTFTPMVAGIGHMRRRYFVMYNIAGALCWTVITVLLGYWLGKRIPNLHQYLVPGGLLLVAAVFGPAFVHLWRARHRRRRRR
jgi:membrane-associated protein